MSQSSGNQADNFELRPRTGGMPIISLAEPLTQAPLSQNIEPTTPTLRVNGIEVVRAETAYLDSTDPDLTFGYTFVYVEAFSHGIRLPFSPFVNNILIAINRAPGQLRPIGGWLNVTIVEVVCRMCGIEPTVSLFSILFFVSYKSFQTKFSARAKRNILAGTRPNRVRDSRFHKKWFYARGGMAEGVPHIWTLKEEARGLQIPSAVDMDLVGKLRGVLP
ncbi:hypothetical protein LIER_11224 [Lithospermum erythrorhizon]|uniref:Transposase (putative) gypsy type domain-containing protein n=1 Tax=Lithospermum erythrorhizon TaxID=34254 RepID=A0AAV3PM98_LITER